MKHSNSDGPLGDRTPNVLILLEIVRQFVRSACTEKENDCEFFEEDDQARWLATGMTEPSARKYRKHEIIPAGFFLWLQAHGFLPHRLVIPQGGSTVEQLILILRRFSIEAEQVLNFLKERRQIRTKRTCSPELNRAFGTQQGTWTAIENVKLMRHAHQPR